MPLQSFGLLPTLSNCISSTILSLIMIHFTCWMAQRSIKCLVAVAGDSARLVSSVHVYKEVLGVMGLEVQSDQQEDQCPCRHCITAAVYTEYELGSDGNRVAK